MGNAIKSAAMPAPAATAMDGRKHVDFIVRLCDTRIAEATARLNTAIDSITRESVNAKQWVADSRGTVGCFANNIAMRAMEMAAITAEIEQHKAVRMQMVDVIETLEMASTLGGTAG